MLTISESVPAIRAAAPGVGTVSGDAVAARAAVGLHRWAGAQLGDGGVVALDEAVEAPLLLQDVGLGVLVGTPGNPVDRVEGAHDRVGSRVDGGLERRQVEVAQPGLGHVGGVVVTATLGLAVGDVVLHARDDLVRSAVVRALGTLDAGGRHHRAEVRVLARTLDDAAPPGLVGDVHHWAVDLLEALDGGLLRADHGVGLRDVRVEGTRGTERHGEDRAIAVDGVVGEEDRDVQSRLLDRDVLEVVDLLGVDEAEDRAHARLGVGVGDLAVGEKLHLLQLLLRRHL